MIPTERRLSSLTPIQFNMDELRSIDGLDLHIGIVIDTAKEEGGVDPSAISALTKIYSKRSGPPSDASVAGLPPEPRRATTAA
jgi:hypothetical protein